MGKNLADQVPPCTSTVRAPRKDTRHRHGHIESRCSGSRLIGKKKRDTWTRPPKRGRESLFIYLGVAGLGRVRGHHAIPSLSKTKEHALCRQRAAFSYWPAKVLAQPRFTVVEKETGRRGKKKGKIGLALGSFQEITDMDRPGW